MGASGSRVWIGLLGVVAWVNRSLWRESIPLNIAIIPARGGSKRIPHKNLKLFCGQPILKYSIDNALKSGLFARVIVSTDCPEISRLARNCGAEVPFVRPPELADDFTPTIPVIRHAIQWCQQQSPSVERVCCLYATAPMLQVQDLVTGWERLRADAELDFAFAMTSFAFPIFRALRVTTPQQRVAMFWPEQQGVRSQDLEEAYHDAGQFYWGTVSAWLQQEGIFTAKACGVLVPRHRVQDIDTPEDWLRAEALFRALGEADRV